MYLQTQAREANKMIDDYIYFYNHERIQLKTGLAPLTLRQSCWDSPTRGGFYSCLLILGQFIVHNKVGVLFPSVWQARTFRQAGSSIVFQSLRRRSTRYSGLRMTAGRGAAAWFRCGRCRFYGNSIFASGRIRKAAVPHSGRRQTQRLTSACFAGWFSHQSAGMASSGLPSPGVRV